MSVALGDGSSYLERRQIGRVDVETIRRGRRPPHDAFGLRRRATGELAGLIAHLTIDGQTLPECGKSLDHINISKPVE
jgi:hypothetical protein